MKNQQSDQFSHQENASLLRRCRNGDDVAWSRLVDRFQALVYSIPRRMGLGVDDASDVFQATFLALHRNLDKLDEPAALAKWMSVTASRESLRVKRLNSKTISFNSENQSLDELIADEQASAETIATDAVESEVVQSAVQRLPQKCRDLLTMLCLTDDVSYEVVSTNTGMAIGSIGPTRARCLEKLRGILSLTGFFGDSTYQPVKSDTQ